MNRQILEEATNWFVNFRVGDVDNATHARFDEWLRTSPEHIRAYLEIAKTYVELPSMTDREVDPNTLIAYAIVQPDLEANVVPFQHASRARQANSERHETRVPVNRRTLTGIVATVCAVAGLLITWAVVSHDVYATGIGERRLITLSDGSTIDLNARSKVRVRFSQQGRAIELIDGQALFQVATDKARPFVVQAAGAQVRAVGTQFDVYRKPSGTTVTVLEGRVAVLQRSQALSATAPASNSVSAAQATLVAAGEQVTVTNKIVTLPKRADVAAATAWMQRELIFEATPLGDVIAEFNRYNRRQLIVEDRELTDFHVSGTYSSTDPASLLRFLRDQPGIRVVETDESVRIGRR